MNNNTRMHTHATILPPFPGWLGATMGHLTHFLD